MPTAAAAPDKNAVGNDQNSGAQLSTPAAASDNAAIETTVFCANEAATTKQAAPNTAGMARCQRRSRRASALRPKRFMATMAQPNGMALTRPMAKLPFTPVALTSVGIQKVSPYWPITKQK